MFKKILILLTIFGILLSQDTITYVYTAKEVLAIDNYIQELEQKDSLNVEIINNLEEQMHIYIQQAKSDSVIIDLKNSEIQLLNNQILMHQDLIKEVTPKWYDNKWIWFVLGIITTSSSIYLAGQVIN